MSIHVTPIPRLITLATPAFTLGTANTAGDAITAIASNSTILTYDTTVASTLAFGGSATTGSATVSARRDHSHGMPADPATAEASQAQMEAASVGTVYASPRRTQYHPGVAKAWCKFNGTSAGPITPDADYNCDDVTDNGTGNYTVNWTTDFSGSAYCVTATCASQNYMSQDGGAATAGGAQMFCNNDSGSVEDTSVIYVAAFGDQ